MVTTTFFWMIKHIFHSQAPGGSIILEGEKPKTSTCVFEANEDTETLKSYVQVWIHIFRQETFLGCCTWYLNPCYVILFYLQ